MEKEDYDLAKEKKQQMERFRSRVYEQLQLHELVDAELVGRACGRPRGRGLGELLSGSTGVGVGLSLDRLPQEDCSGAHGAGQQRSLPAAGCVSRWQPHPCGPGEHKKRGPRQLGPAGEGPVSRPVFQARRQAWSPGDSTGSAGSGCPFWPLAPLHPPRSVVSDSFLSLPWPQFPHCFHSCENKEPEMWSSAQSTFHQPST